MSATLEQACARAIQVDRQTVADLTYLLADLRAGATLEEIEQLLNLVIRRAGDRMTVAHAAIWQALHPDQPGVVPPLLPVAWLVDTPSCAQRCAAGKCADGAPILKS